MKVENWPISRPIPYSRNPRRNEAAISKVASSIKEFGWRQPIVVDSEGVIIAGHTRLLAAQQLGLKEVPVHVALDMNPIQVKAYRLADNRVAQEADWDNELLALEIEELSMLGMSDLDPLGFDTDEIHKLRFPEVVEPAEEFQEVDEDIDTDHECPKCGYKWSGGA